MAEFTVDDISFWYRSKEEAFVSRGIMLAGIKENRMHLHSALADLDTSTKIARIIGWVSGEFDFEILNRASGEFAYFRHESVLSINDPKLELAFEGFVEELRKP
jgi:hypothetical protein